MKKPTYIHAAILGISLVLMSSSALSWTPDPEPPGPVPEPCNTDCSQGPYPTTGSVEANMGPFSISSVSVPWTVSGFGGGTIYYPSSGTTGSLGAIALIPGFLGPEWTISAWGERLASHGFIVITVATNAVTDQPDSRATQLSRALDHVIIESGSTSSPIYGMVDPNRLGAMGISMGGGGTLKLTSDRTLSAAVPMVPWYLGFNDFESIDTPTLIIGCENDTIAPVALHSIPFYNAISDDVDKAYLEMNNGSHGCVAGLTNVDILGKYAVSWMKRFIDNDQRYDQFLCGPNHTAPFSVSDYRDNCDY